MSAPRAGTILALSMVSTLVLAAVRAQEPAAAALIAKAEAYVDLLSGQQFAKAYAEFDSTMKGALPEEQLRAAWLAIVAQFGAFKQRGAVRTEQRAGVDAVLVTCQFERGRQDVQVVYNAAGQVIGLSIRPTPSPYTPPVYVVSGSYVERDVIVGGAEWPLPATLTTPVATGPVPAVVLVHGSGPNDRDETIGPNKIFRDLALGLASQGIAVLRYDKRSRVHGSRMNAVRGFTVKDEVVDDVVLAVELLRGEAAVDPARIVVLGHSLGGMLVPRIAVADSRIAGFVVMAGAARPLEEAIVQQTRYLAMADGSVSAAEQSQIDTAERLLDAVRKLDRTSSVDLKLGGAPASYWLDLKGYDPPAAARAITRPMLVLQGERDYQVTVDEFARWKAALSARAQVTLRSYPLLNHLFIEGVGPSVPAEYMVPGHVAETVVRDIAAWIRGLKG